jgi:hypothetical protein
MVCRQDVQVVSEHTDREAPVSEHTSAATTVISRQTASTYRREILQGYTEKHVETGVPKKKVPLDDETLTARRDKLNAYEEAHPRQNGRMALGEVMESAARLETHSGVGAAAFVDARKRANTVVNAISRLLASINAAEDNFMEMHAEGSEGLSHAMEHLDEEGDVRFVGAASQDETGVTGRRRKHEVAQLPDSKRGDSLDEQKKKKSKQEKKNKDGDLPDPQDTCQTLVCSGKNGGRACGRELPCRYHHSQPPPPYPLVQSRGTVGATT